MIMQTILILKLIQFYKISQYHVGKTLLNEFIREFNNTFFNETYVVLLAMANISFLLNVTILVYVVSKRKVKVRVVAEHKPYTKARAFGVIKVINIH